MCTVGWQVAWIKHVEFMQPVVQRVVKREHRVTMRCFLVYISLNLSMCMCFVELKGTSVWFVDISRSMTFLSNLVSVV